MMHRRLTIMRGNLRLSVAGLILACSPLALHAQGSVTTPREQFGHEIGADYVLPSYQQLASYWQKLAGESDRMQLVSIGRTAEGREQLMAIISSPQNLAQLDRYRQIARRLALAEGTSEAEARQLAEQGRAVVWIDGGLHANEVLGPQQLLETVYQLVSRTDAETQRILDDVIILAVHANPDGHDLVSDWYMRQPDPTQRSLSHLPRLYQKYAGHDNNRDSYMNSQPETQNMSRIMFREWFPQIVYNHHQTGPTGAVMFAPPFRDPFNFHIDPLIPAQLDAVGAAMHSRFIAEDKPGVVTRRGANYSTWWNGGIRTTVYFHNMIGLLTETIGSPTPTEIPFVPRFQLPTTDIFAPVAPTSEWRFRQSIDYSVTANYAVLDYASRHREQLLYNIYHMGRSSIARGSTDHWTPSPWALDSVRNLMLKDPASGVAATERPGGQRNVRYQSTARYYQMLREPQHRDARGYILPADQPDFRTAAKFVDALLMSGVAVQRATRAFTVNGKRYPAGSFVVKTAQAFRPHVLDMFEPQQHPNDFQYPGGPPVAPYDNAGYTLALQMGVQFDRVLDGFDGPFEAVQGPASVAPGRVLHNVRGATGYSFTHRMNDAAIAVNRLLRAGHAVYWLRNGGAFFVRGGRELEPALREMARELGVDFHTARPGAADAYQLRPARIALWDQYGGSMASGWLRFVLENFEFSFDIVYPPQIDGGDLRARYDVLILPDGAIPRRGDFERESTPAADIPAEYQARLGSLTRDQSAAQLKAFAEQGGTIIAIGGANPIAEWLGVPVENALVTHDSTGAQQTLERAQFYVPGSVLEARLDTSHPLAQGLPDRVHVLFDESPVFKVPDDEAAIRVVGWYEERPLRSGWAWGQEHLEGGAAIVEADVGAGKLFLFGPEITFRAQPHGTFKLLFNGIFYGTATATRIR